MTKYHDQGKLKKKEFVWAYGSGVLETTMVERSGRWQDLMLKAEAHILNHNQEAESELEMS